MTTHRALGSGLYRGGYLSDELRRAVAIALRDAREHAALIGLARQYGQLIEPTDEDVLAREEFDQLLDPLTPHAQQFALFRRFIQAAVAFQRIEGLEAAHSSDEHWLNLLFDATLNWGEAAIPFLGDPFFTEFTIAGTTAIAGGPNGGYTYPNAYASVREPLSRAEFLVLATGVIWNRATPVAEVRFPSGTRVMLAREPIVVPHQYLEPGLLVMIQRERPAPWTLAGLVEHGMLDRPVAALLSACLHASCSFIVSGMPGSYKTALLEGLVSILRQPTHTVVFGDPTLATRFGESGSVSSACLSNSDSDRAFHSYARIFFDLLTLAADTLVVDAVNSCTAAPALCQAETGTPTLLSIDAATPVGAHERLARLASMATSSYFSDTIKDGLRVIGNVFHLHIHTAYSSQLEREYISEVLLISMTPGQHEPTLVPLVEAVVDDAQITWTCHAELRDRRLVWNDPARASSTEINRRLSHVPDDSWAQWLSDPLARPSPRRYDPQIREYERLLRLARIAMRKDERADTIRLLTEAASIHQDHMLEELLDEALTTLVSDAPVTREIADAVQTITAALDDYRFDEAQILLATPPSNILVAHKRERTPAWQNIAAQLRQAQEAIAACQAALQEARTQRQSGDLTRALQGIRSIAVQHIPPDLQRTVLMARRSLLSQLIAQSQETPDTQQAYITELEQVNRALSPEIPSIQPTVDAQAPQHLPASTSAEPTVGSSQTYDQAPANPVIEPAFHESVGWLDAALERNRERIRLRQAGQEPAETA